MRVVSPVLNVEARGGQHRATVVRQRGERKDVDRGAKPEHPWHAALWESTEPIQCNLKGNRPVGNWRDGVRCGCGPRVVDLSEEVHRQMERFRTRPANFRNALTEPSLQPLGRSQPRLSERNGEEAPHPAGAVAVGLGLRLAGAGVGLGAVHGLPPALVRVTSIWFALHSWSTWANSASVNQLGRSVTLYGLPA